EGGELRRRAGRARRGGLAGMRARLREPRLQHAVALLERLHHRDEEERRRGEEGERERARHPELVEQAPQALFHQRLHFGFSLHEAATEKATGFIGSSRFISWCTRCTRAS